MSKCHRPSDLKFQNALVSVLEPEVKMSGGPCSLVALGAPDSLVNCDSTHNRPEVKEAIECANVETSKDCRWEM